MNRVYNKYQLWEDYQNGMYNIPVNVSDADINSCILLLSDCGLFFKVGVSVLENWPIASSENLTNTSCNRRAWLGQSACCYHCEMPETVTRLAWKELSIYERNAANAVADKLIRIYENKNTELYKNVGAKVLF